MQADILKKIDVLVDMAGSSVSVDTLQAELNEIEKESDKLNRELSLLTSDAINVKYFKASEKQVDENIKVSLESKIRKQEATLDELQEEIDSVSIEEAKLHDSINVIKEKISSSNEYIVALSERIATISDATSLERYKNTLEIENKRLEDLNLLLNKKEEEYSIVLEKLNYLDLARKEIYAKLESDKEQLVETKASLVNPTSYVDEDLKKIDEGRIDEITKHILELDKRRIEIITDPAMIAEEAKKLIDVNDFINALSKIKELVTIVKEKPYMNILSQKELDSMLPEEFENASNIRDEFAALIDSKDYNITDSSVILERIEYLKKQIAYFEEKIRKAQEEISSLDTNDFVILNEKLLETIKVSEKLELSIQDYEEIIANGEDKTPKRRGILNSAFQMKQKDLENVYMVIESYKKDQKDLIKRTYDIEAIEIASYEESIKKLKDEIEMLNNALAEVNKTKDVLAMENDKKKLKELDDAVKAIQHRQKYNATPNEIFDEIEIYLGSVDDKEIKDSFGDLNIDLNDTIVEKIDDSQIIEDSFKIKNSENKDEVIESVELEDSIDGIEIQSMSNINSKDVVDLQNDINEFSKIDDGVENERLKVVSIEPIENPNQENPFIIGEYKDSNDEVD